MYRIASPRRNAPALLCALALGAALAPTAAAAPLDRFHYSETNMSVEEVCGEEWSVTAVDRGTFMLKQGRHGDPTPYFFQNYQSESVYTDPGDPTRGFVLSSNGLLKDLRITLIEGTTYEFLTLDVGQPSTISTLDGRAVARDRGRIAWRFVIDTKGGTDLDQYEILEAEPVAVNGQHPILGVDDEAFCGLVADAIGE